MSDIDDFSSLLFEQSKHFLEKAKSEKGSEGESAYLHAALLLGVSALEAHINAIADELIITRNDLTILERSILSEKEYLLENGEFVLKERLKMYRLGERLEFIFRRFSIAKIECRREHWWGKFVDATRMRNDLVHPKAAMLIKSDAVESALQGILETLDALYKALYKRPYPSYKRALNSKLNF